jgi:CRP-like cAMP-binding protein
VAAILRFVAGHPPQRTLSDLRAAQLFAHLSDDQLVKLAALARPERLPAARTLFLQGDRAGAFFLLAEGRLKIFKVLRDGRTATLRHVEPRQTFAEAALFRDTYPSSTETMSACLLYRFDAAAFLGLLQGEPEIAVSLLAAMAELLGYLNRRVEELLLPVPARLARYLLALADEQLAAAGSPPARDAGGPGAVRLPTNKRELASRLGTVPETLSRTFDRLKRADVISMSGGHEVIEILDLDKLHRLAQE